MRILATWLVLICMLVSTLAGCGSKKADNSLGQSDDSETSVSESESEQTTGKKPSKDTPYPETAKEKNAYILGKTQQDALSYKVGEEIKFNIHLTDSEDTQKTYPCSRFVWNAEADDGQTWSGSKKGDSGRMTLGFTMTKPGAIRVTVRALDQDGNELSNVTPFVGGAFAGFDQIKTGVACPADFDEFWQNQLNVLDQYQPEVIEKKLVSTSETFYTYSVKIRTHQADAPVTGYLVVPKDAKPGSLKIRLSFSGYESSTNKPTPPTGSTAYITLSVNAHSMENGQPDSYYADLKASLGQFGFSASDYTDPSTSYFRNMILRDVQALRYAKTLPEWNGKNIELSGGSMGGFQATAVAALEPGVTKLTVHIVWMCDVSGRSIGRLEGWLPEYTANLNYFDSVNFAARVPCPTTITRAGLIDYTTTPIGVAAYYNALKVEKSIEFVQSAEHILNPKVEAGKYRKYN